MPALYLCLGGHAGASGRIGACDRLSVIRAIIGAVIVIYHCVKRVSCDRAFLVVAVLNVEVSAGERSAIHGT